MRMIQSVAPDLSVGLTDANRLVLIVDTDEHGEQMVEVTDIDELIRTLRHMDLIKMEPADSRCSLTTAEAELNRRTK